MGIAAQAMRPLTLTKLMLVGRRAPLTRTPADAGLAYEPIGFEATDGIGLRGWFIPRAEEGPGPAVVFVHGWLWNRLGNVAGQVPVDDDDVDFMPSVVALHEAGYHVLLFDQRHHGGSESGSQPLTYGVLEAQDYLGAVRYLRSRPDVDSERVGALGTSMGANAIIYGTAEAQPIPALLAIQPTRLAVFNTNFARSEFGPLGPLSLKPIDLLYKAMRAPAPKDHDPAVPARGLGDTVVQYVQGTGDQWGEMGVVEEFAAVTPNALPLVRYPSTGRYQGYRYVTEEADAVAGFFREHL